MALLSNHRAGNKIPWDPLSVTKLHQFCDWRRPSKSKGLTVLWRRTLAWIGEHAPLDYPERCHSSTEVEIDRSHCTLPLAKWLLNNTYAHSVGKYSQIVIKVMWMFAGEPVHVEVHTGTPIPQHSHQTEHCLTVWYVHEWSPLVGKLLYCTQCVLQTKSGRSVLQNTIALLVISLEINT